jgi:hypothetical protein
METTVFVPQGLSRIADALFASAECACQGGTRIGYVSERVRVDVLDEREKKLTEILCCFWNKVVVELNDDPACWDARDRDIKEGELSLSCCWFAHLHALHTH